MESSSESPVSRSIQSGTQLRDRYSIERLLGEGGFAKTYLAFDRERNDRCVIKALSLRNVDTLKAKELFDREAKVLANLNHPHIPKFIDVFTDDSREGAQIYLVQEFKNGKNLSQLVAEGKHFTEKQVIRIGIQMAEILEYLQSFSPPIIHRDIKPSNILLSPSNQPSLIDFGAVRDKIVNDPLLRPDAPTIVGTYGYMPLEQFEGRAVPASDIYSLGATLIFLLSHKDPWEMDKREMRLHFEPHLQISEALKKVLRRMIEPDAEKRYANATDLKTVLEEVLKPSAPITKTPTRKRYLRFLIPAIIILTPIAFAILHMYSTRSIPKIVNGTAPIAPIVQDVPREIVLPPFLNPRDVSGSIQVEQHGQATTYRFDGDLSNTQVLDIAAGGDEIIWIGTSKGVLRYHQPISWRLFGLNADIPGERVNSVAVGRDWVAAELSHETRPGYALATGTYLLDPEEEEWTKLAGSAWDLYRDGNLLWIATGAGVEAHDLNSRQVIRFDTKNSGLLHNQVYKIRRIADVIWIASLGDYVQETKDFKGGGISRLDLTTKQWSQFTPQHGLARGYSCAIAGDETEVWIAHWEPEYGLSHYETATGQWSVLKFSENGVPLGGVVLAMDPDYLWIGQQSGLIRLDRKTRRAVRYTEEDGLPGRIVSGIEITDDAVWVTAYTYGRNSIANSGAFRIPRNQ